LIQYINISTYIVSSLVIVRSSAISDTPFCSVSLFTGQENRLEWWNGLWNELWNFLKTSWKYFSLAIPSSAIYYLTFMLGRSGQGSHVYLFNKLQSMHSLIASSIHYNRGDSSKVPQSGQQ